MTAEREEILIERAIAGEATPNDWSELERLASDDADLWRRLARAQREQSQLREQMNRAAFAADRIDAPVEAARSRRVFTPRWRAWSGWAAAAALAIAWLGSAGVTPTSPPNPGPANQAGVAPAALQPDEALERYLTGGMEQGRVVGEAPKVMINSEPTDDGRAFDVLYMRRILERARVRGMYSLAEDDAGRPTIVPVDMTSTRNDEPM